MRQEARGLADRIRYLTRRGDLTLAECNEMVSKLPRILEVLDSVAYANALCVEDTGG